MDKTLAARIAIPNMQHQPAVHIFNAKGSAPKAVLGLFDERVPLIIEHRPEHWSKSDLCIFTSGGLALARERAAARLGAIPVVLPAAGDWAGVWIAARLALGSEVYLYLP